MAAMILRLHVTQPANLFYEQNQERIAGALGWYCRRRRSDVGSIRRTDTVAPRNRGLPVKHI